MNLHEQRKIWLNEWKNPENSKEIRDIAFWKLYDSVKNYIYYMIRKLCPNRHKLDEEELVSRLNLTFLKCLHSFIPEKGALTTWITGPIIHTIMEYMSEDYGISVTDFKNANKIINCINDLQRMGHRTVYDNLILQLHNRYPNMGERSIQNTLTVMRNCGHYPNILNMIGEK